MSGALGQVNVPFTPAPPPNNPAQTSLGMAQQAMGLQLQANQNALFQREFAARQAMGGIVQQSIDPATGQPDLNKMFVLMSQNPDTAFKAPEFLNTLTQRQLTQQDIALKQLDQAKQHSQYAADVAGGLLARANAEHRYIQPGEVIQALADAKIAGRITDQDYARIGSQLDLQNPANLHMQVLQLASSAHEQSKTMEQVLGTYQGVQTGGQYQPLYASPYGGTRAGGEPISMTPTPGEMNATQPTIGPGGAVVPTPRAAVAPMYQTGPGGVQQIPGTGGGTPGAPSATPGSANPQTMTEYPAVLQQYLHGQGPIKDYENDVNSRAQQAQTAMRLFQREMDLIQQFKPGAGTGVLKDIAQGLQALGADPKRVNQILGVAEGNPLAAIQEFEKYAIQLGTTTAVQLRGLTGAAARPTGEEVTRVTEGAVAQPTMDPQAIQNITTMMQKLTKMPLIEQQKWREFANKWQNDPTNPKYNPLNWQAIWGRVVNDPEFARAHGIDVIRPQGGGQ